MLFYHLFSLFSVGKRSITSCERSGKYGSNIYIDFNAISRPCTCTALPSFDGELIITSVSGDINYDCGTQIHVKNAKTTFVFGCPISSFSAHTLTVNINQSVDVRADYLSPSTSGMFFHCIQLQRYGMYVYVSIHVSSTKSCRFVKFFFLYQLIYLTIIT